MQYPIRLSPVASIAEKMVFMRKVVLMIFALLLGAAGFAAQQTPAAKPQVATLLGVTPGWIKVSIPIQSTSTQQSRSSENDQEGIPIHDVPQYLPCRDQTRSFKALSDSFRTGHLPSRSEISGSWVLVGFWLYKDSHPDLNCAGIMRGRIFEWVMLADGYSLGVDMAGNYLKSAFEPDRTGSLKFTIDLQGDTNPVFQCRLTQRRTLVCLGTPYYSGIELKKIRVDCEPLTPQMLTLDQGRLCLPYKQQ